MRNLDCIGSSLPGLIGEIEMGLKPRFNHQVLVISIGAIRPLRSRPQAPALNPWLPSRSRLRDVY